MDQKSQSSGYCQTFSWAVGNALPSSLELFLLKHHLENPINSFPKPPRYFTFHFEQWITGNCRIQTIFPSRPKTQILSAVGLGWFHPGSWIQNWGIDKVSCSPLPVQQIPNLAPVEISCRSSDQKSDKRRIWGVFCSCETWDIPRGFVRIAQNGGSCYDQSQTFLSLVVTQRQPPFWLPFKIVPLTQSSKSTLSCFACAINIALDGHNRHTSCIQINVANVAFRSAIGHFRLWTYCISTCYNIQNTPVFQILSKHLSFSC